MRRAITLLALMPLVAADLSACSAFLFDDEELEPQRVSALPPADDEEYPTLSSVPDAPPLPSSRVRRLDLAQDLAADRENAIYTDESLRATDAIVPPDDAIADDMPYQGDPGAAPPPPAFEQTADLRPLEEPDFGAAPPPPGMDPAFDEEGDRSPILPPDMPEGNAMPVPSAMDAGVAPGYASSPQMAAVPQNPDYQQPLGTPPSYGGEAQYGQPPVLLQQQAVQQQIYEANQLQNMAMQQQAYAFEARRQAIEQQQIREQIINQNAWQLQTLQQQAGVQMAALPQSTPVLPPMGYAGSEMPVAAPQAPGAAYGYPAPSYGAQSYGSQGYGAQGYGAPAAGGPAYGAPAQTAIPGQGAAGQLVGLIYFGHGSTSLNDSDLQVLRQVVGLQQQTGGRPLRVVGHASARTTIADPVRHRMTNLNVSMTRANHVASELVRMGANQGSVQVMGRADSEPVYHEFMPTGEAGNRRVEIFIE